MIPTTGFHIVTFTLDAAVKEWAKQLALKRSGSMNHADTRNSMNMLKHRPPWWRHYIGVLGELAYAWHTGQKVDQKTIGKGDDGTDFPDGVQVKTSDCAMIPSLLFPVNQWKRKQAKGYVLAWVHSDKVSLIGWITREEIERVAKHKDFGYGDSLVVDHKHLNPMEAYEAHR